MKISKAAMAFGILGGITAGCISDFDKFKTYEHPKWEPRFAVPVVDASLTLGDIVARAVANENLSTDSSGKYTFTYYSNYKLGVSENAIPLPDQNVQGTFNSPVTGTVPAGSEYDRSYVATFQVDGGRELTSIDLKNGTVGVTLASSFSSEIGIVLEFPTITKEGTILTSPEVRVKQSSAQVNLDITQYNIRLDQEAAQPYNRLPYRIKIKFYDNNTLATSTDVVTFRLQISQMKFSAIEGFLGAIDFGSTKADTVDIDLFKSQAEDAHIVFANPQVSIDFINSYGVSLKGSIINPTAILRDNSTIVLKGPGVDSLNNTTIQRATKQQRNMQTSAWPLTKDNTENLVQVFGATPSRFAYDYKLNVNAGTSQQLGRDQFLYDTSSVTIRGIVKLPMEGRVVHYAITDTLDLKLPKNEQEQVKEVLIRMIATNGFPVDLDIKAIILDENDQKVDSIVHEYNRDERMIAAAAKIDAQGRADQQYPTISTRDFLISNGRYSNMAKYGRKMVVYARINTTRASAGQDVALYNDYKLRVQLGAQLKMSIDLN